MQAIFLGDASLFCRGSGTYKEEEKSEPLAIINFKRKTGRFSYIDESDQMKPDYVSQMAFVHNTVMGNKIYLEKTFSLFAFSIASGY